MSLSWQIVLIQNLTFQIFSDLYSALYKRAHVIFVLRRELFQRDPTTIRRKKQFSFLYLIGGAPT